MNYDFNNAVRSNSISIEAIKVHASNHIEELQDLIKNQKALASNSEDEQKVEKEKNANSADDMDSMVFDLVLFSAISSMFSANFAFIGAFNSSSTAACLEGACLIMEDRDNATKGKLYDYPQGRVSFKGKKEIIDEGFNLVSKNKKKTLNKNKDEDKKCMHEILDMTKKLEKEGIKYIEVNTDKNIYDSLKKANEEAKYSGGVIRHTPNTYVYGNA